MPELLEIDIDAKVRQVRRRQFARDLLNLVPGCLAVCLGAACLWLLAQPFLPVQVQVAWYTLLWMAPAAAVPLTLALAIPRFGSKVDSALALDGAFNLKERVTTAVSLNGDTKDSPAGQALLEDLQSQIAGLDVASRFPIEPPRRLAWPAAAAIAFAAVVLFYDPSRWGSTAEAAAIQEKKKDAPPPIDTAAIKRNQQQRKELAKELQSERYEEIESELEKLIQNLGKPEKPVDLKKTTQEVAKIGEEIRRRQEELSTSREIQQKLQLSQELKKLGDGPASEVQKALANGNLEKAKQELEKLAQQMKEGKMSEEQKQALAKQLEEIAKKLNEVAEQKERKENVAKSDADPEAKAREMDKIERDAKKLEALKDLAMKLSECQQGLKGQSLADAAQALEDAMGTLDQVENYDLESELLKLTKEDLERLKKKLSGC